jgi:OOP family OmpA-OmpF porin
MLMLHVQSGTTVFSLAEREMNLTKASNILGLAILAALASPCALAQDSYGYIGGNVGASKATIDDKRITSSLLGGGFSTTSIADDSKGVGYKVFGGWRINKYFAVEGGYFDLGKFGFKATTVPAGTFNGDIKVRGVNLDLVGFVPIGEKFSLFGRVGADYAEAKDHFTGTGLVTVTGNPNPSKRAANYKFGVGVQYDFSTALSLRAEAERYRIDDAVGNKGDIDLLSVGLLYRFGGASEAPPQAAPPPPPEPVVMAPPPHLEKYTLAATELFAFNKAELRLPETKLDEIADALNANPGINNVVITGYTDRIGSEQYNQALSERRAQAVKDYLVGKGVDASRLQAVGKGEANPVVVCTDKVRADLIKCLEPNRRVEVEQITIERPVQ